MQWKGSMNVKSIFLFLLFLRVYIQIKYCCTTNWLLHRTCSICSMQHCCPTTLLFCFAVPGKWCRSSMDPPGARRTSLHGRTTRSRVHWAPLLQTPAWHSPEAILHGHAHPFHSLAHISLIHVIKRYLVQPSCHPGPTDQLTQIWGC